MKAVKTVRINNIMGDTAVEGFSRKTLDFLVELRMRNDREWYYEHKPDYERYVAGPFKALVAALTPAVAKIDTLIDTTPAIGKTISRVYRDSRFTSDKSLYRENAWLTFCQKIKEFSDVPAFYFELTPSGYRYGVGFYSASPKTMEEYRASILRDEEGFLKIIRCLEGAGEFAREGESYKKNRYTGSHPEIAAWYNHKSIYLAANRPDVSETFDNESLVERLARGFESLADIYRFWLEAAMK